MADRPILFSGPMVRALLAETKTQTRRIAKFVEPQSNGLWHCHGAGGGVLNATEDEVRSGGADYAPIAKGDRLWVREAWRPNYGVEGWREDLGRIARPSDFDPKTTAIEYLADGSNELNGKNRPGIHMPLWASRITLLVSEVRVERLQDISEEDAVAEGIERAPWRSDKWLNYLHPSGAFVDPVDSYRSLWESINGPGSWATNPWVVAYSFSVADAG